MYRPVYVLVVVFPVTILASNFSKQEVTIFVNYRSIMYLISFFILIQCIARYINTYYMNILPELGDFNSSPNYLYMINYRAYAYVCI